MVFNQVKSWLAFLWQQHSSRSAELLSGKMEKIKLQRATNGWDGTFGILSRDGVPLCATLEDPWNNNQVGNSCIPAGTYRCKKFSGTVYKNVWEVQNVPGRTAILIHQGNTIANTRGCILVGFKLGYLDKNPAVLESKKALDYLRSELPDEFVLEVKDPS